MLMRSKRRERKLPFTMVSLHQMHRLNWILVYCYVEESLKWGEKKSWSTGAEKLLTLFAGPHNAQDWKAWSIKALPLHWCTEWLRPQGFISYCPYTKEPDGCFLLLLFVSEFSSIWEQKYFFYLTSQNKRNCISLAFLLSLYAAKTDDWAIFELCYVFDSL